MLLCLILITVKVFMLQVCSVYIYLPSTVASRAIRMYMPFSAWRKYAALGSVSTSTLREKQRKEEKVKRKPVCDAHDQSCTLFIRHPSL